MFGQKGHGLLTREQTILDEMILRQTLQAARTGETLSEEKARGCGYFIPLGFGPSVHILQQVGKRRVFQRTLKVLVSG